LIIHFKILENTCWFAGDDFLLYAHLSYLVVAKVGGQKQISLNPLKKLNPTQVKYEDLSHKIEELAGTIKT
jgi:hypothetical protein